MRVKDFSTLAEWKKLGTNIWKKMDEKTLRKAMRSIPAKIEDLLKYEEEHFEDAI